jgi:hypothetical protein
LQLTRREDQWPKWAGDVYRAKRFVEAVETISAANRDAGVANILGCSAPFPPLRAAHNNFTA